MSGSEAIQTKTKTAKPAKAADQPTVTRPPTTEQLTAQIRAQQDRIAELEESLQTATNERSRALEEAQALTHLGSWQWDVATNDISWSDELYRLYGMKPQEREVSFDEFMGMIHDEDRERIGSIIATSFQSGKPFEFEHRIVRPDGAVRFLHGVGKVIRNRKGEPVRMIGTSQDITSRAAAEAACRAIGTACFPVPAK